MSTIFESSNPTAPQPPASSHNEAELDDLALDEETEALDAENRVEPSNIDADALSLDEIAGGYDENEDGLISQEFQIKQDEELASQRSHSEKGGVRFLTVTGGIGGAIALTSLVWFGFLAPRSPVQKAKAPEPEPTSVATPPGQTAALKSQLAFAEQQRQLEENNKPKTGTPEAKPSPGAKSTASRQAKPPTTPDRRTSDTDRTASRAIRPVQSPSRPPSRIAAEPIQRPTPVARTISPAPAARSNPAAPARNQTPPVDPFARWQQLAELGQTETPVTDQPNRQTDRANPVAATAAIAETAGASNVAPSSSISPAPLPTDNPSAIQSATIGEPIVPQVPPLSEGEIGILSQQIPAVDPTDSTVALSADPNSSTIPIEQINSSEAALFDAADSTVANNAVAVRSNLIPKTEQVTLASESTPVDSAENLSPEATLISDNQPREVTLGSSAQGTVMVPLIWSQDGRTQTSERGAIELTEPLLAKDGSVALPKGSTLITQTTTNGVPRTDVIAVIRRRGNSVQQYPLPPNILVVRSESGTPLSGRNVNEVNPSLLRGEDLLVGAIGGLGQIGEILNQPQIQTSSSVSNGGFSQSTTSQSRRPDVVGAILQGALQPASKRIESRIQQRERLQEQQRSQLANIAVIPKGEKVTIVAQNILRVNP